MRVRRQATTMAITTMATTTTVITTTTIRTTIRMIEALRLMAWLSPGYPVGAYAYSHGLEGAVETGGVTDEASLGAWLSDVLERGSGRNDLILLAQAHAAALREDAAALADLNDLALALAPSRELHLETSQQGRSFLDATRAAWGTPSLERLAAALDAAVAYPVAVGLAAGAHRMALPPCSPASASPSCRTSSRRPCAARPSGRARARGSSPP